MRLSRTATSRSSRRASSKAGTVKVNGSAAYVAADQLTMTMNQGLFDIQVDVGGGTDDANGIVHTG